MGVTLGHRGKASTMVCDQAALFGISISNTRLSSVLVSHKPDDYRWNVGLEIDCGGFL